MWKYRGQERPPFAEEPGPGQESVWDYPRPPAVEPSGRLVVVRYGEEALARSRNSYRVMETASPPVYYLPPEDVNWEYLEKAPGRSVCEWKGVAQYWKLSADPRGVPVGWSYEEPRSDYRVIQGYVAFYPGRVESYVEGENVRPQPGNFYGGWVTDEIIGPFKGESGTGHW